jgi:hypothetical protein
MILCLSDMATTGCAQSYAAIVEEWLQRNDLSMKFVAQKKAPAQGGG